jgi:phosphatidylserine/phosphatidylglycerophosphate/cardiolipin synthase-like enzyme
MSNAGQKWTTWHIAGLLVVLISLSACHGSPEPTRHSIISKVNVSMPRRSEQPIHPVSPADPLVNSLTPNDIEIHYSPEEDLTPIDCNLLASARSEISISAFSFTNRAVSAALEDRAEHGVKIRVYRDHASTKEELNRSNASEPVILELLRYPEIEVRVKHSSVLAHLKAYEVDGRVLRTGSANFSPGAESRQDNDLVIIYDLKSINDFKSKFQDMWDRPDNEALQ